MENNLKNHQLAQPVRRRASETLWAHCTRTYIVHRLGTQTTRRPVSRACVYKSQLTPHPCERNMRFDFDAVDRSALGHPVGGDGEDR